MCTTVCSILAVYVIACVTHISPVESQCTTRNCLDDDNDVNALTTTVYHVRDTVERHHQDCQESLQQQRKQYEELQQQFNDSMQQQHKQYEEFQQQFNDSVQEQHKQYEELQQQFNDSVQQQHKQYEELQQQLTALKRRLPALDCYDLMMEGETISGVYNIFLVRSKKYIQVFCDMETDGGGWTIFQRRQDGSVDFWRDWATYKKGFGDLSGEFWLGNDYLHEITSQKNYSLRIDLEDFDGATRYAVYMSFAVAPESEYYKLSHGMYNGTAGDSLGDHLMFRTKDRYGHVSSLPCVYKVSGGWWNGLCVHASLNGQYFHGSHTSHYDGVSWPDWRGQKYSLKKADMKLRP